MQLINHKLKYISPVFQPFAGLIEDLLIGTVERYPRVRMPHEHDGEHADVGHQDVWRINLHFPAVKHFRSVSVQARDEALEFLGFTERLGRVSSRGGSTALECETACMRLL